MKITINYSVYNSNVYKKNNNLNNQNNVSFTANPLNNLNKNMVKKTAKITGVVSALAVTYATIRKLVNKSKNNNMNEDTIQFLKIRNDFSKKLEKEYIKSEKASWNFYINSTPKNMEKYEKSQDDYAKLFQNKKTYLKLKMIDKDNLPLHEQKQLKELLKNFEEELNSGEELKVLRQKENEIAKKYNSYVLKIDDKEVNKTELNKIIQTEKNPEIRQKAYQAKIQGGDLIAEDLIEFVKLRNEYAKSKGYDNYFDYKLKEDYEVESEFLDKLIDEVYSNAGDKIKNIQNKKYSELKKVFSTNDLKAYHYGLLLDSEPDKDVNLVLEKNNIEEISKKIYENMGYDVDKMVKEGKLTLDLYPRKNKNTHGFCFGVEAGKDSRILANLTNNVVSLDTLNHEMGHCIYDLGISTKLTFLDKQPASPAMTEAIAMMMGDIMKKENVLSDIVSEDVLKRFKESLKTDEANFVTRSLMIINFEREIYRNPEQDPAKLWSDLKLKYLNRKEEPDNEWATIPHYLSHPAYYQNYFRASLMKAQIYNYLYSQLGNITENKDTAKFMNENIFSLGASVNEYELIKNLTGKEFSSEDFVKGL